MRKIINNTAMFILFSSSAMFMESSYAGCTGECVKAKRCINSYYTEPSSSPHSTRKLVREACNGSFYTCSGGISISNQCYTDSGCNNEVSNNNYDCYP